LAGAVNNKYWPRRLATRYQLRFETLPRSQAAQIPAVKLKKVERAKYGGCFAAVTTDQVKDSQAIAIGDDCLAVDQA